MTGLEGVLVGLIGSISTIITLFMAREILLKGIK
jgi:hypothetical protein|tara:strand:- start:171 stop:272 length:102 start_codon:yes stop_codon:yes gene_type:complete